MNKALESFTMEIKSRRFRDKETKGEGPVLPGADSVVRSGRVGVWKQQKTLMAQSRFTCLNVSALERSLMFWINVILLHSSPTQTKVTKSFSLNVRLGEIKDHSSWLYFWQNINLYFSFIHPGNSHKRPDYFCLGHCSMFPTSRKSRSHL